MEIWLDTIDLDVIAHGAKTGIIYGVTTNPSILSRTKDVPDTLKSILDIQPGPVAVQVTSMEPHSIVEEALKIFEFSNRMIVKIPINYNGLIAMEQLKREEIPVMGTGVLYPTQVLLGSSHHLPYIAPYLGHMGEFSIAIEALKDMVNILKVHGMWTKILAAALRDVDHIIQCALVGVDAVTIKAEIYNQLVADSPAVEAFSQRFASEWMNTHGNISIKDALQQPQLI